MKTKLDPRHTARKLAMCAIFSWLFSDPDHKECMDLSKELLDIDSEPADLDMTNRLVEGVTTSLKDIDSIISKCAPEWPIDKISKIDLVILRLAVYELIFSQATPAKVTIDEAVELAKEFGNDTSGKFINGVLGSVADLKTAEKKQNE